MPWLPPLELLVKQIAKRNPSGILEVMFQRNPPALRDGFFKEDELWDYKEDIPPIGKGNEVQWANIAADVLAFHNQKGGVLIFGIPGFQICRRDAPIRYQAVQRQDS